MNNNKLNKKYKYQMKFQKKLTKIINIYYLKKYTLNIQ